MRSEIPTYLFVLPWSLEHLGGVNQVVINLGHAINKSGRFATVVLICDWNAKAPVWGESHGLRTVRWRVHPYSAGMGFKERVAFQLWSYRFSSKFRKFCMENRVAVINPHYPGPSAFSLFQAISKSSSRPTFVVSFHGTDVTSHKNSDAHTINDWGSFLQECDGVVACSSALRNSIRHLFGEDLRIEVIHNGIELQEFVAKRTSNKLSKGRVILSVGKYVHLKGQDVLIRAFSLICRDFVDIDLVFVGSTGDVLTKLKKLCEEEGIPERVHFYQDVPHDQLANFYAHSTVFVLPSRAEAFGIVIMEAAAFCLPVIASRVGGTSELVIDGDTGILVCPDNPVELADRLHYILSNPLRSRKLGVNLHEFVKVNFTWTAACNKYFALAARK